jgi:hypothetical protein
LDGARLKLRDNSARHCTIVLFVFWARASKLLAVAADVSHSVEPEEFPVDVFARLARAFDLEGAQQQLTV